MASEDTSIRRFLNAVEVVRDVDAIMPIQTLAAFLTIATNEGININTIASKTEQAQSAASRNVSSLTEWSWKKKPGLKLVEYRTDPMNLSQKPLYLTEKGRRLLSKLASAMEGKV